jgi:hypothetical protein
MGGLATLLGAMTLMTAAVAPSAESADGTITARPITYTDLGKLVRGYRGKVVVVDFWSVY